MASPIALNNLVLIDGAGSLAGPGDLIEVDRAGTFVQQLAPNPGGPGAGTDWHLAQLGAELLLAPKAAGDILRVSRTGDVLGTFVPGSEFGIATIHLAKVDEADRLLVLYEVSSEAGTIRLKRFACDGSLAAEYGPITLSDGLC
jgi:hypothetical protein